MCAVAILTAAALPVGAPKPPAVSSLCAIPLIRIGPTATHDQIDRFDPDATPFDRIVIKPAVPVCGAGI